MNSLKQLQNGIFASQRELDDLKKKEKARILVYSDSHGDVQIVSRILEQFGPSCDALVFAGDGIYDLLSVLEQSLQYKEVKEWLPPVICFVRGNNDYSYASATFEKKICVPKHLILEVGSRKILVTHGNEEGVYYDTTGIELAAEIAGANSVIYGHTHFPMENNHVIYSLNPGSCSCPRLSSPCSCCVLEVLGKNVCAVFYKINSGYKTEFEPYFPDRYYF